MSKVLITTVPFANVDRTPLDLLENAGVEYLINPLNKKLTPTELSQLIDDFDVLIAGTEIINEEVLNHAKNLKFISRVGIGLDALDLAAIKSRNIKLSYTADAPAPAVAELTMGLILSLIRNVHLSNKNMHEGKWNRYFGKRIEESAIGIVGVGRIGSRVLNHLTGFNPKKILVHDVKKTELNFPGLPLDWVSLEQLLEQSDIISFHLPLSASTKNLITRESILKMKRDTVLINTSRGGIINEEDLYQALRAGELAGAAVDVFEEEPYNGPLNQLDNVILTAHMGSMSVDCRTRMEIEATEEAIRFIQNQKLLGEVPASEYENG
jgi:D-3-phosphoglycerate dehydrogenase